MYFTPKQLRIVEFIQKFRCEKGISPTLEEIAKHMGVTKITIYEHINQLIRKGVVKREKFRARSIEILCDVPERSKGYELFGILVDHSIVIPEMGINDNFKLPPIHHEGKFLFVKTDSYGPAIQRGDFLEVQKCDNPKEHQWAIVKDRGQAVLQEYRGKVKKENVLWIVVGLYRSFPA